MAMRRTVLTYEDYAALPDDGRRYEIHDGELSVTRRRGRITSASAETSTTIWART